MLTNFHARGFRTFEDLEVARLARVNLVVGRNNVGKTMLLHALRVFRSEGARGTILELLRDRDELVRGADQSISRFDDVRHIIEAIDIAALFHARSPKWGDEVILESQGPGISRLRISLHEEGHRPARAAGINGHLDVEYGSEQRDSIAVDDSFAAHVDRRTSGFSYSDEFTVPLLASGSVGAKQIAAWWDKVSLTDAEKRVIDCLRIISPIERVAFVDQASFRPRVPLVKVEGMSAPIPLRALGDGVGRMFAMALGLEVARSSKLLLIDEIENGIHYSALPEFWRFLFKASAMSGVQLVATSHSWDCIESFQQAAAAEPGAAALVKLSRKDGHVTATVFDEQELQIATRDGIELR